MAATMPTRMTTAIASKMFASSPRHAAISMSCASIFIGPT
jgi:hypothetical protein